MATDNEHNVRERMRQFYQDATSTTGRSLRAWNELLAASTDMAFDVVLKNWNYSRSLRGSAEQAVEDAIKTQHRLSSEMLQVWQNYTNNVHDILKRNTEDR